MKKQKNKSSFQRFNLPLIILLFGFGIRIFKLDSHMMFIGDFAWFYFSAEKILSTGEIPLVGIETSQIWLHQGPFWTYLITPVLGLINNPLSVGYFSTLLGSFTILLVYLLGKEMFSKSLGLIAAFLFTTSPLVIVFSRMPYHTSPIPLFTVLLVWFSYRWIKYGWNYFPFVVSMAAVLYNFELATVVVIPVFFFLGFYVIKKHGWRDLITKKIISRTLLFAGVPMLPIIIYDIQNEFLQTLKFAHWSIYLRAIKPLLESGGQQFNFFENTAYYFEQFRRLIFLHDPVFAFIILLFFIGYLAFRLLKQSKFQISEYLLWLFFIVPFALFLINKTRSDAYLPLLFIPLILLVSFALYSLFNKKPVFLATLVIVIGLSNVVSLISNNYLMQVPNGYGLKYEERVKAVRLIKDQAQQKTISIVSGNNLSNVTLPYEYLLILDGYTIDSNASEKFEIYELLDRVNVQYKSNTNK